ncbi:hypothetical protein QAD02_011333 [Eretmocerus hayati]|uniref:Uncharacterized protein n=1 Tax=Eretmocerus hayati TaxID=131215 RepID=A0ACC2NWR7_9HYME|nr:hypothetical protein QAD02_011333 [Eretmocerus hayati]
MERWQGKVAVVTGASSGIGAYLVEVLVRHGLKVVGLARRLDLLNDMAGRLAKHHKHGSFHPVKCDLSNEHDILAAFKFVEEKMGPVAVLVNNAGFLVSESIIDGTTANMRRILDVNVLAVAICIREASRSMRKHSVAGHIINVNSVAGHEAARIRVPLSIYCASKYAVTGLTESVRTELASLDTGIKITSVSPGPVRTEMIRNAGFPDDLLSKVPILEAKDVADAIIYSLSTPHHVQVNELTITPLDETVQEATSLQN